MMLRSLCLALLLGCPVAALGQSVRVGPDDEYLRAAPDGAVLATVLNGTELRGGRTQGAWREVTLEGWIWSASVAPEDRDGHDLVVRARDGENLRASPDGTRLARLRTGMLLDEVDRDGNWVRVRRTAWIRTDGLLADRPATNAATPAAPARTPASRTNLAAWARMGHAGAALLAAPDKDTIAAVRPLTPVEVLAREGNWARVRLEGWVWVPSLAAPADTGDVLRNISPQVLAANPQGFQGRLIEWTVQFIALEHAERIRTDFYEGEPFILARGPGDEAGFVYIAVPPDRVEQVKRLAPLQRITVLARVRTARSAIMGAPVLDLLGFR
ncbi:MAG TPA: hypothetical protein VF212_05140 [Longimicrobiales bacterium]